MEKKAECEIVQDLLLGYVDNTLNPESEKLVEGHLKECKNCTERLQNIKNDMKQDENTQQKEIDYLKQIKKSKSMLKLIISILSIFIVIMWIIVIENIIEEKKEYERSEYISNIITTAYNKINEIQKQNNYSYCNIGYNYENNVKTGIQSKYVKLYKDGYYKEEGFEKNEWIHTNYGVREGDRSHAIHINKYSNDVSPHSIEHTTSGNYMESYINDDILYYRNSEIRDEVENEVEYYVITTHYLKAEGYYELWIRKDNMQLCKDVRLDKNKVKEIEYVLEWKVNNVTDEDVKIQDLDGYEVDEFTQNWINDYNLLKK